MATYVISDVHGCMKSLAAMLARLRYDPDEDHLWFVGDLVNTGPRSLDVLRWARRHDEQITVVLGNHDLHLLAVASGTRELRDRDTFGDVLEAPDADALLDWLRHRPLLHRRGDTVMVHAGLLPQWNIEEATECAREVESQLRDEGRSAAFFERMYGNEPRRWRDGLDATQRQRLTVNALTRMRAVDHDGALDFSFKGELGDMPDRLTPWFRASTPRPGNLRVVFGHWSAIGYHAERGVHALDSGCVWGRQLTALRFEDEEVIQVPRISSGAQTS